MRVPWTAGIPNQPILKEISPEYSLEGLMLKLKLQYYGHLIAVKSRDAKSKEEKERYKHLNAEFQRIARRDKKASSAINAKK